MKGGDGWSGWWCLLSSPHLTQPHPTSFLPTSPLLCPPRPPRLAPPRFIVPIHVHDDVVSPSLHGISRVCRNLAGQVRHSVAVCRARAVCSYPRLTAGFEVGKRAEGLRTNSPTPPTHQPTNPPTHQPTISTVLPTAFYLLPLARFSHPGARGRSVLTRKAS